MRIKKYSFIVLLLLALPVFLFADADQGKIKKGIEAYEKEQWDEALNHFQDALLDDPENPRLHFNVGSVQYQKQKYEEALQSFQKALLTKDVTLQESAYYNIGNTYYQMNKYQESIEAYKKALDLEPTDQDAKNNLELVRAKLKEMADKQQQQNQQQQQIEPSEYAKQLKAQAEALVAQRFYKEAHQLMEQGLQSDPTVAAFQSFIDRLKDVVEIEEGKTS
jgi:tetratricopeptide (TPR) repeat protein